MASRALVDAAMVAHLRAKLGVERAALIKYWISDNQCKLIDECLQLFGGYGYMKEYVIARLYADCARAAHLRRHQRNHEGAGLALPVTPALHPFHPPGASPMTEAYIYDAVRTPRGKGKKDGSLHQATPAWLLRTLLQALQARNAASDTALVDDLVLGCVTPVGEQGADIARTAVLDAGWAQTVAGVTQSRFAPRAWSPSTWPRPRSASGMEDMVVAGGVESMSRWAMGSDGGAWVMDPRVNSGTAFIPQGISADLIATLEGFGRADLDAFAAESHRRAAQAQAEGRLRRSIVPVKDINGMVMLDRDETMRPGTSVESLAKLNPRSR